MVAKNNRISKVKKGYEKKVVQMKMKGDEIMGGEEKGLVNEQIASCCYMTQKWC